MSVIFKCKTREGYAFKVLGELLQSTIKNACFKLDKNGIKLRMMDHHRTILIDLELDGNKFNVYKYRSNSKVMHLGINLTHLYKMLKSIKKRDSIELFIKNDNQSDLGIKVIPKENNRITTSYVKIQHLQNIDIDIPDGYQRPVIVPSGEFQKMCKGLTQISNQTRITARGFSIRFASDAGGVMKRYTEFGETEDSDTDSDEDKKEDAVNYHEDFDTDQLTRITKLSGLSSTMQIFVKNGDPLRISSDVGSLGRISIYLKSKNLQQAESHTVESIEE